jgi:hypothetical protein
LRRGDEEEPVERQLLEGRFGDQKMPTVQGIE